MHATLTSVERSDRKKSEYDNEVMLDGGVVTIESGLLGGPNVDVIRVRFPGSRYPEGSTTCLI